MVKRSSSLSRRYGSYGSTKYKILLALKSAQVTHSRQVYIAKKVLCVYTGVGYYSLGKRLSDFVNWGYITSRPCLSPGYGATEYRIERKGLRWLELAQQFLPSAGKFHAEYVEQARLANSLGIGFFVELPFKEFLVEVEFITSEVKLSLV